MCGKTHITTGLAISAVASVAIGSSILEPAKLVAVIIACLLPDIDIDGSTIAKRSKEMIKSLIILAIAYIPLNILWQKQGISISQLFINYNKNNIFIGVGIMIIASIWARISGHRGFSHSILGVITFSIAAWIICKPILFWFTIGYISHLAIDLLNFKGEELFYPSKEKFKIGLCEAGGIVDTCLGMMGLVIFFFMIPLN